MKNINITLLLLFFSFFIYAQEDNDLNINASSSQNDTNVTENSEVTIVNQMDRKLEEAADTKRKEDEAKAKRKTEEKKKQAKKETKASNLTKENGGFLDMKGIVIISLLLLLFFFGFITLFLLRWRMKHNKNLILFPENLFDSLDYLNKNSISSSENFKKQVEHFNKVLKYIRVTQDNNDKSFNSIIDSFTKLNDSIVEKENEIKQLRKGYESKETFAVIRRMIRLYATVFDIYNDTSLTDETKKEINIVLQDLEEKLIESGVKSYTIDSGTLVTNSQIFGVPESSDWIIESTSDKKKDNVVSSTLEKGFYFDGVNKTILKYVKIKVLKLN